MCTATQTGVIHGAENADYGADIISTAPQKYDGKKLPARKLISRISLAFICYIFASFFIEIAIILVEQLTMFAVKNFGGTSIYSTFESILGSEIWLESKKLVYYVILQGTILGIVTIFTQGFYNGEKVQNPNGLSTSKLISMAPGLFCIGLSFSVTIAALASMLTGFTNEAGHQFEMPENPVALIICFVATAIVPPIVEEYVFRRVLYSRLAVYGSAFAIITSSVFFALGHIHPVSCAATFTVGFLCAMTVAASKTGSILPCIVIHTLNNTISFLQTYLLDRFPESGETASTVISMVLLVAGFVCMGIIFSKKSTFLNCVICGRENETKLSETLCTRVLCSKAFIVYIIICLVFAVITEFSA